MRNLLFLIATLSLFSCNNQNNDDKLLLELSTIQIENNGSKILKAIYHYNTDNNNDSIGIRALANANSLTKKYNEFKHIIDSTKDLELMRKTLILFNNQNEAYFREEERSKANIHNLKLSSKEFIKNAGAIIFYISLNELNKNLTAMRCGVLSYMDFRCFSKSDSIKVNKEYNGIITYELYPKSSQLTSLLKNNYKVNYIKRNGKKVNDVKLHVFEKDRNINIKPSIKGQYEIEILFSVINLDSSITTTPLKIDFLVF